MGSTISDLALSKTPEAYMRFADVLMLRLHRRAGRTRQQTQPLPIQRQLDDAMIGTYIGQEASEDQVACEDTRFGDRDRCSRKGEGEG
jgi:hypothetical protein